MKDEFYKKLILEFVKENNPDRLLDIDLQNVVKRSSRIRPSSLVKWLFEIFNKSQKKVKIIRNQDLQQRLLSGDIEQCERTFQKLSDEESRVKFTDCVGFFVSPNLSKKIELPASHHEAYESVDQFVVGHRDIQNNDIDQDMVFEHKRYPSLDSIWLSKLGYCVTFLNEQYRYKDIVCAKPGGIALDIGACYGDTALYFADKVGINGRVYSFEFVESNIKRFQENISRNEKVRSQIELVRNPVWSKAGDKMHYKDSGPGTKVSFDHSSELDSVTETLSLDKFVDEKNIERVDFIKMDIEGAELDALIGATNLLKNYKPDLAICVYHKFEHLYEISDFIDSLNLGYQFYFDYYTSIGWEMVLYATIDKPPKKSGVGENEWT